MPKLTSRVPWEIEMPALVALRRRGWSYREIADTLVDRYGGTVTEQSVRARVAPNLSDESEAVARQARESERESIDRADATRIAQWLQDNPASTKRDVATGLDLPLYRVEDLTPLAYTLDNGYVIPPAKQGHEQVSDKAMVKALKDCAKDLGISKREPFAQGRYEEWRRQQTDERRMALPSPIAYRRRFGTWTKACEMAGLMANELPRVYEGLSIQDIIVHLAVWLRALTDREAGLVDASQGEYRQWLRIHPQAPSEELIRMKGSWANFLAAASILEKTTKKLPVPTPVGTGGRRKKPPRALPE
jgi:hypothetical protein